MSGSLHDDLLIDRREAEIADAERENHDLGCEIDDLTVLLCEIVEAWKSGDMKRLQERVEEAADVGRIEVEMGKRARHRARELEAVRANH